MGFFKNAKKRQAPQTVGQFLRIWQIGRYGLFLHLFFYILIQKGGGTGPVKP
jgi:hypothetical protein